MYKLDHKSRLSRFAKRYLSLMSTGDAHVDGEIRRTMIRAELRAADVRNNRNVKSIIGGDDTPEAVKVDEAAGFTSTVPNVG